MEGVWVVCRQNADIADTLHVRGVAMATVFGFPYGVQIGAISRIRLNRAGAVAMRPYVKLL